MLFYAERRDDGWGEVKSAGSLWSAPVSREVEETTVVELEPPGSGGFHAPSAEDLAKPAPVDSVTVTKKVVRYIDAPSPWQHSLGVDAVKRRITLYRQNEGLQPLGWYDMRCGQMVSHGWTSNNREPLARPWATRLAFQAFEGPFSMAEPSVVTAATGRYTATVHTPTVLTQFELALYSRRQREKDHSREAPRRENRVPGSSLSETVGGSV